MEVPIPRYFLSENAKAIKEREKLLGTILAKMGPPDLRTKMEGEASMTTEEAVKLIQVHERARQGRLRAKLMKEIRYTHTPPTHPTLVCTYILCGWPLNVACLYLTMATPCQESTGI